MPIIAGGPQLELDEVGRRINGRPDAARNEALVGDGAPAEDPLDRVRIGVVFVHGIGAQKPGETLLDWSRPIVKLLADGRRRDGVPGDPVVASRIDFSGSAIPVIELDVPSPTGADPKAQPHQTWFLTEAWWASSVRPPTLGTMVSWLAKDLGRVVDSVQAAADERATARIAARAEGQPPAPDGAWWIHGIDRIHALLIPLIVGLLWFSGAVLAVGYSLVRSLPLVGDKVAIAQLDTFLIDWFGDLRVLLHDPSQAANIRGRVAEALAAMRDQYACTSIVVVAHSGGVIVSLTLLGDERFAQPDGRGAFPITRLVTIGQAMRTAWSLWDAWLGRLPPGDRLLASPYTQYPDLRWLDLYGTYDPASAGRFLVPEERTPGVAAGGAARPLPAAAGPSASAPAGSARPRIEPARPGPTAAPEGHPIYRAPISRPIWNRMSFREDHGGYWDNDEQYTISLVREIDTSTGHGESRFFPDPDVRQMRVRRRIERVAVLGWWRLAVVVAALLTIVLAVANPTVPGGNRLAEVGAFAGLAYGSLPGHEIAASPLAAIGAVATQVGRVPGLGALVGALGEYLVALAVLIVIVSVPGWYGLWRRRVVGVDRAQRVDGLLAGHGLPRWLPDRIAIALAISLLGSAILFVGSRWSVAPIVVVQAWLEARIIELWSVESANALIGLVVIVVVFAAIEVLGVWRWKAWDEGERWQARADRDPADFSRRWAVIQGAALVVIALTVGIGIALVNVPTPPA
ncbi:MAG: hypothetical protein NVS9B8_13800 [Candidatus Limnocylindrales bacterium]